MAEMFDLIVIGGGPGGYTTALYAARAGLDTLVLERMSAGGQMALTTQIDNYPGFPQGVDGWELSQAMAEGAERFGAEAIRDTFKRAFTEWKHDYKYLTELVMVLNHKCWQFYQNVDAYSKLYDIPSTGLRFFTVYGPAGRPDMAYFGFTNKLVKGDKIQIFNFGNCKRDFTYVDDIVEGVYRVMMKAPEKQVGEDGLPIPPYKVYNIGNNSPENLLDFVTILQEELIRAGVLPQDYNFEAHKELVPMQAGDVPVTYADTTALEEDFGFKPSTSLREGLRKFAEWYKEFYK